MMANINKPLPLYVTTFARETEQEHPSPRRKAAPVRVVAIVVVAVVVPGKGVGLGFLLWSSYGVWGSWPIMK